MSAVKLSSHCSLDDQNVLDQRYHSSLDRDNLFRFPFGIRCQLLAESREQSQRSIGDAATTNAAFDGLIELFGRGILGHGSTHARGREARHARIEQIECRRGRAHLAGQQRKGPIRGSPDPRSRAADFLVAVKAASYLPASSFQTCSPSGVKSKSRNPRQ